MSVVSRFILSSAMSTAARLPELLNRPFFDVMNMNESSIEASSSWFRAAVPSSWFAIMVNAKAAKNRLKTSMMEKVSTEVTSAHAYKTPAFFKHRHQY